MSVETAFQSDQVLSHRDDAASDRVIEPELLDRRSLAIVLKISTRSLDRMESSGKLLAAVRCGGSKRWRRREVLQWIAAGLPDRATWAAMQQR